MNVDGTICDSSTVITLMRCVHPCGLAPLDALFSGGFPRRAVSQVFLVSVPGLPMRSHVNYDLIGLLNAD
jgi:hypothetical protein